MAGLLTRGLGLGSPLVLYGLGSSTGGRAASRDRTILATIAGLIRDTNEFSLVTTSGPPEDRGQSGEHVKLAGLELAGWRETHYGSDAATQSIHREVNYTLYIHVRDPDPDARDDEADRLYGVAANAVNGQAYDDDTFAHLCFLRAGVWERARGVERRVRCTGQFVYPIPDYTLHNTD